MKTYTIEGATWAPRFTEKFWFDAATVRARNKKEALREFKETTARGTDSNSENVTWTNSDAPSYVSYRVKKTYNFTDRKKQWAKAISAPE